MYQEPHKSPWGKVQACDVICPGVFMISTADYGGIMVAKEVAAMLSPAARKCGFERKEYICFEQDAVEDIVFRELLDKKLWSIPTRVRDKAAFEENINKSIREYNPEYWRSRQRGQEAIKLSPTKPSAIER